MASFVDVMDKNHLQLITLAYLRIIHQRKFVYIVHFLRRFIACGKEIETTNHIHTRF